MFSYTINYFAVVLIKLYKHLPNFAKVQTRKNVIILHVTPLTLTLICKVTFCYAWEIFYNSTAILWTARILWFRR